MSRMEREGSGHASPDPNLPPNLSPNPNPNPNPNPGPNPNPRWITWSERAVTRTARGQRQRWLRGLTRFNGDNMLQSRGEATRLEVRTLLMCGIVLEWLLLFVACLRPFQFYLPLRPAYLVLMSDGLSSTFASIWGTIKTRGMRSVAVCFFTLWMLAAMFASTLLRSEGNGVQISGGAPPSCPPRPSQPGLASPGMDVEFFNDDTKLNRLSFTPVSFQTFTLSLISTFILISTGENYADVVSRSGLGSGIKKYLMPMSSRGPLPAI